MPTNPTSISGITTTRQRSLHKDRGVQVEGRNIFCEGRADKSRAIGQRHGRATATRFGEAGDHGVACYYQMQILQGAPCAPSDG